MNDNAERMTTKQSKDEKTLEDCNNRSLSGKRSRQETFEPNSPSSPRKIRKTTISMENSNTGSKEAEIFDFGQDSVLLEDLLGDFHENVPTSASLQTPKDADKDEKATEAVDDFPECDFDGDFDVSFDESFEKNDENKIDFGKFCRCKVVEIQMEKKFRRISVKDPVGEMTAVILCYGFWREIELEINDTVSIKAKKVDGEWIITNENGFLVTQPNTLISGTSVVASHFCLRRGVLQESFRGLDSLPNMETDGSIMMIGCFVHEVLQIVLQKKISLVPEIKAIIDAVVTSHRGIKMLYDANMSLGDCKKHMLEYVPKIFYFVNRYIEDKAGKIADQNFHGKIEHVREIEENIWLPELGLKGKIDVTVEVNVNKKRKIMPLEVKTGRSSFSAEHRGQIILYSLMLNTMGTKVDSGLLLYIKDNIMQEVKNNHPEERDLILLRNSFANYITKSPEYDEILKDNVIEKVWKPMKLPEPINHRMACPKCPYSTLCSIYAERDESLELSESHVLKSISREAMQYLQQQHIDYVMKWVTMLQLDDAGHRSIVRLKDIWKMEPRDREVKGCSVCNLKVSGEVVEDGNMFLHNFVRKNEKELFALTDLTAANFTEGEYILVSTDTRINVSTGYVHRKTKDTIQVLLERNVVRQNPSATFHLDKYPSSSNPKTGFANVAALLLNNEITNKLRAIVIDRQPSVFSEKLPKSLAALGANILYKLNKYQRHAILKVMTTKDYLLIKGMPGTGKSQTLVALIHLIVKLGRSVLVTAHTHSAVDNILLKLNEKGIDFLRLGTAGRIHPTIMHKSEQVITADCKTPEELEAILVSKNVVGVTCYGSVHTLLSRKIFDFCLVDESTQVLQATILRPMFSAKTFVLVGDPEQLPAVVKSNEARKMGMSESLFARLDNANNTVLLKLQYRMNKKIMSIANHMTYQGNLKAGNSLVETATLEFTDPMVLETCERWVARTLSQNLEDSVVMLDTGDTISLNIESELIYKYKIDNKRVRNVFEAAIILRLVAALIKGGIETKDIGVICPFRSQVDLLHNLCPNIEVNTVDQYQGRDKDVILYSCTRSSSQVIDNEDEFEILEDAKRLNVAVTRAKHKLIIIGDRVSLDKYTPFKKLFKIIKDDTVNLKSGIDDFSWQNLLQLLE